jgi:hypothetical protein
MAAKISLRVYWVSPALGEKTGGSYIRCECVNSRFCKMTEVLFLSAADSARKRRSDVPLHFLQRRPLCEMRGEFGVARIHYQ